MSTDIYHARRSGVLNKTLESGQFRAPSTAIGKMYQRLTLRRCSLLRMIKELYHKVFRKVNSKVNLWTQLTVQLKRTNPTVESRISYRNKLWSGRKWMALSMRSWFIRRHISAIEKLSLAGGLKLTRQLMIKGAYQWLPYPMVHTSAWTVGWPHGPANKRPSRR